VRFVENPDGECARQRGATYARPDVPVRLVLDSFIEGRDARTVLRRVSSGFGSDAAWHAEYDATARGWVLFLRTLKRALERHAGQPIRNVARELPLSLLLPQVCERLMGPDGLHARPGGADAVKDGEYALGTPPAISGVAEIVAPPASDEGFAKFDGTIFELDDAPLWLTLVSAQGRRSASLMLIAHGVPAPSVEGMGQQVQDAIERLLSGGA
jgi:hypothetical protein